MLQKAKIQYLEALRGIAALIVVIYHFKINSIFNNQITQNGWLMVDFFFVLSGYVIALNYQNKLNSTSHILSFQIKRFFRLYPLHLLTLILFTLWLFLQYLKETYTGDSGSLPAFGDKNSVTVFISQLFLLHNIIYSHLSFNYPSWSISAEFYTYLLFAVLTYISKKIKFAYGFTCAATTLFACIFLYLNSIDPSHGFARCIFSFFLGVITLNISQLKNVTIPNFISYAILIGIIFLFSYFNFKHESNTIKLFAILIYPAFIISLTNSKKENLIKNILCKPLFVYIGSISYGIYMFHVLIIQAVSVISTHIFSVKTIRINEDLSYLNFPTFLLPELVLISTLALIICVSHLSLVYLENPMNNLGRKFSRKV